MQIVVNELARKNFTLWSIIRTICIINAGINWCNYGNKTTCALSGDEFSASRRKQRFSCGENQDRIFQSYLYFESIFNGTFSIYIYICSLI